MDQTIQEALDLAKITLHQRVISNAQDVLMTLSSVNFYDDYDAL
jgi:hypothetical protein